MTEPAEDRRTAVNKIFGEVLPETTSDERGAAAPDDADERERWLRDNIPPHHG